MLILWRAMKAPHRSLTHSALFTLLFILTGVAQGQGKPMPDRWRGLVIDESTPEDAIRILGQPQSDKLSDLPVRRLNNWITMKVVTLLVLASGEAATSSQPSASTHWLSSQSR